MKLKVVTSDGQSQYHEYVVLTVVLRLNLDLVEADLLLLPQPPTATENVVYDHRGITPDLRPTLMVD